MGYQNMGFRRILEGENENENRNWNGNEMLRFSFACHTLANSPGQYSKDNGFFVMPALDRGRVLVLPPKQVKKVYSLPESMLDVTTTGNNSIQTKWTIWDEEVSENPIHMHVIRNQLTRNLDILTPVIAEELERGFMREWGTSKTEWKTISTWASALHIVAGAANSAFCGQPLCEFARASSHEILLLVEPLTDPLPLMFYDH